jgi:ferrous iron transport protein A
MVDAVILIRQLEAGQRARVEGLVGDDDYVHRLEEFGLRSGTYLEVFRSGNPCILKTAGGKLCLRSDDLLDILVRKQ